MTKKSKDTLGLYRKDYEHDACGIGMISHVKGLKSHTIVRDALTVLKNLAHRGACGYEENSGDGAGILSQIPHDFFSNVCSKLQITLPAPECYGVGVFFLPQKTEQELHCKKVIIQIIEQEEQEFLGWRTVPTQNHQLGDSAKFTEPKVVQAFIGLSPKLKSNLASERKLYVIRKRIEQALAGSFDASEGLFYCVSLSSQTIIYKGMLLPEQVEHYYPDLIDPMFQSAIALVHSRFSTNTFPSWERAHPNRMSIHNGEINTLRGNVNWMNAREKKLDSPIFDCNIDHIKPILDPNGSDSAILDNCLEFLTLGGRPLAHALMMMIPEPWVYHESMTESRKAFYRYHAALMEPWDGPASLVATDGEQVVATLDRNGLRPTRYWVTDDDRVILASETGVLDVEPQKIIHKGRLEPGRMLIIDTKAGAIITDEDIKTRIEKAEPYGTWLDQQLVRLWELPAQPLAESYQHKDLLQQQMAFGYTFEDKKKILAPMVLEGKDPLGSMGNDTPLSVLSDRPRLLFDYFKQLFAQVTNPPIDAIRESLVTATDVLLGPQGNLLHPSAKNCHQLHLDRPILNNQTLANIKGLKYRDLQTKTLSTLFDINGGHAAMETRLSEIFQEAQAALDKGANLLLLSDRGVDQSHAAIPILLVVSALHHHLIETGRRTETGLLVETAEAREVHHFCLLLAYGTSAINPYLALDSLKSMITEGLLPDISYESAADKYVKTATNGITKVLSKMGISTVASYCGAQIFECIGLQKAFIDRYFSGTASRIEGVDLPMIANETLARHQQAFTQKQTNQSLDTGGNLQWRKDGEYHLWNPETIHLLQQACRENDASLYADFSKKVNLFSSNHSTLRSLLEFQTLNTPLPIDEVESVEAICRRFKTGAMSYGSISQEAHESLAIAMNRIGGKSNTGEGGEDPARYQVMENGDTKRSAIKQVASGRFGVDSYYLVNADEIQIKMAQGAKPGEGGQLPGKKVYPWVAKVRNSTPGVELISPPPHHDIYSIEDLAELIHDLKNANPDARINVKLVSEVGVGTIAAGVAKGHADVVLISGHDGGTGASPITSTMHAGLPWELGLAETHQTLVLNKLRGRITIETDGQLKTGRDVAVAALLGAEEFGFSTAPLITMGCIMMRKCHLGTCPVGIATQTPELREKFQGDPKHVVNYMHFIAEELRQIMAQLGFRTVDEMVGRVDKLKTREAVEHWKAHGVDLSDLLQDVSEKDGQRYCTEQQNHELDKGLDQQILLDICEPAIERGERVSAMIPIKNIHRVVGTLTGSKLTKKFGQTGLPDDTIELNLAGSAGQSFAAFTPKGMSLHILGDANDYIGKGLSGAKISASVHPDAILTPEQNVIVGNVALYGATAGEAYFNGMAGERFAVRNSGASAVVEGVGDHGCEYMTGGLVVVLGDIGRNFAAGMSGGIAYLYDPEGKNKKNVNTAMVELEPLVTVHDESTLKSLVTKHFEVTKSTLAHQILEGWTNNLPHFVKIIPSDYKRVLNATKAAESRGLEGDELIIAAFHDSLEIH